MSIMRLILVSNTSMLGTCIGVTLSSDITMPNNLLAYRPRIDDHHDSNLAGIFINLEGVFPCLESLSNYYPICRVFTEEEDGFRNGRALIDAGDIGNNFHIFSSNSNILTYGILSGPLPVSQHTTAYLPRGVGL